VQSGVAPNFIPSQSIGLLGFLLPDGRRGRDLIVQSPAGPDAGSISIYANGPLNISFIQLARLLPAGARCES
jgi:hypothetical protein